MKTVVRHGQPSWRFASDKVRAAITRQGGHLAPVEFQLGRRTIAPFSVAPWAEDKTLGAFPPILRSLRGDFFCAPFGNNDRPWRGEKHPPHGDSANANWKFDSLRRDARSTELRLSLATRARPGRVEKLIRLHRGETALYCRHTLSGMSGPMNIGHHATLKFPEPDGSGRLSTSAVEFAQVLPTVFEQPAHRGYSFLRPGATFSRLDRVPAADGSVADLSRYPARRGFEDLVLIVHRARQDFAWTAACFPEQGYVWFALKNPRVLRSTIFWISNGGRHYAPWHGRHVNVMGMEDVTSYFHYGLAESAAPNPVSRRGIATTLKLSPRAPLVVNYIMAVAAIPRRFDRVKNIIPGKGEVTLVSTNGLRVKTPVDPGFLYSTL